MPVWRRLLFDDMIKAEYTVKKNRMKFFYRLKNMAETADGADGYFYYFPDRRDGVVYGNSDGKGQLVADLWDMLLRYDGERNPAGWEWRLSRCRPAIRARPGVPMRLRNITGAAR